MIMDGLIEIDEINDLVADNNAGGSFADMFGTVADLDSGDTVTDSDAYDSLVDPDEINDLLADLDAGESTLDAGDTVADSDADGSLVDPDEVKDLLADLDTISHPGYKFPIASGKRNAADDIVHYMKYVTHCSDTVTAMQAMNPKEKKNRKGSMAYWYIFLKVVKGIDMTNDDAVKLAKKSCTDAARQLLRILYASYSNEMIEAGWTISESWKPGGAKRQRVI